MRGREGPWCRGRGRLVLARGIAALLAWLGLLFFPAPAGAHELGLSRGDYAARGNDVEVTIAFARRDAIALSPSLDGDKDGSLAEAEVAAGSAALGERVFSGLAAKAGGEACEKKPGVVRLVEEDGLEVRGAFACSRSVEGGELTIELPLLGDLATGHRQLFKLSRGGKVHEAMLHRREASYTLPAAGGGEGGTREGGGGAEPEAPPVLAFFVIGIEHIVFGWDHLVFLVGLVLVAGFGERRWRGILLAVTAFTLAHSVTLALSVMGLVTPRLGVIEPLIALSVAYVGVENFLVKDPTKRWRVTLPFGLIHGFGFAGALAEVGLPKGEVPAALALFNLGVEAGQLAILAILLPVVFWLAKRPGYATWGVRVASGAIVLAGLFWFLERVT